MSMCQTYSQRTSEKVSDPLELGLEMLVNHQEVMVTEMWTLWESAQYSSLLSHLSGPQGYIFFFNGRTGREKQEIWICDIQ